MQKQNKKQNLFYKNIDVVEQMEAFLVFMNKPLKNFNTFATSIWINCTWKSTQIKEFYNVLEWHKSSVDCTRELFKL